MIIGLEQFASDPSSIRLLYTGLTRANAILSVMIPVSIQPLIDKLYATYFESTQA